jgi:hypothetical protein
MTFKAPAAELENTWLKRVREYHAAEEITIVAEDAPQLLQTESTPESGQQGTDFRIRLLLSDRNNDLFPDGIFVKDERTQRVLQAQASPDKDAESVAVKIPIEANCPPGKYSFEITAIDEAGNLRRWTRSYTVGSH